MTREVGRVHAVDVPVEERLERGEEPRDIVVFALKMTFTRDRDAPNLVLTAATPLPSHPQGVLRHAPSQAVAAGTRA